MRIGISTSRRWTWLAGLLAVALALGAAPRAARAEDPPPEEGGGDDEMPDGPDVPEPPEVPELGEGGLEDHAKDVDVSDATWSEVERRCVVALARGEVLPVMRALAEKDRPLGFALRPASALKITRAALTSLQKVRAVSEKQGAFLVAGLGTMTKLLGTRREKTPESEAARAMGRALTPVWTMLEGELDQADALKAAVADLHQAEAKVPLSLDEWRAILLPAVIVAGTKADTALEAWAAGELSAVAKARASDPAAKRLLLQLDLERGIRLARSSPKEAEAVLLPVLAALSAKDAIPASDMALASRYNRGVTAARRAGLATKADYRTERLTGVNNQLSAEIPLATDWTIARVEGDVEISLVRADGPSGGAASVTAYRYETDSNYTTSDGKELDGDSMGGMLKDDLKTLKSKLTKVRRETTAPGRLSKAMAVNKGFELAGTRDDGAEVRYRSWAFRCSTDNNVYFIVRVTQVDTVDKDPEVTAVLESLAEGRGRKK